MHDPMPEMNSDQTRSTQVTALDLFYYRLCRGLGRFYWFRRWVWSMPGHRIVLHLPGGKALALQICLNHTTEKDNEDT